MLSFLKVQTSAGYVTNNWGEVIELLYIVVFFTKAVKVIFIMIALLCFDFMFCKCFLLHAVEAEAAASALYNVQSLTY